MINRQQPKNPFRLESKICEKCNCIYKEVAEPVTRTSEKDSEGNYERHEQEFVPLCEKCFKKELKRFKKSQWILEMTRGKFINEDFLNRYRDGKVSHKELDDKWREYQKCQ